LGNIACICNILNIYFRIQNHVFNIIFGWFSKLETLSVLCHSVFWWLMYSIATQIYVQWYLTLRT
jgi:hypothetical protein